MLNNLLIKNFSGSKVVVSVLKHVLELVVDHKLLHISQAKVSSVDQALDGSQLINNDKLFVLSVEVDGIKICVEQLFIDDLISLGLHIEVHDSAQDLEEVGRDISQVSLVMAFEVRPNQKILL